MHLNKNIFQSLSNERARGSEWHNASLSCEYLPPPPQWFICAGSYRFVCILGAAETQSIRTERGGWVAVWHYPDTFLAAPAPALTAKLSGTQSSTAGQGETSGCKSEKGEMTEQVCCRAESKRRTSISTEGGLCQDVKSVYYLKG